MIDVGRSPREFKYVRRPMRGVSKSNLPAKRCPTCGRPFSWRKKWAKDWEAVRYCSERCRNHRASPAGPATTEHRR